MSVMYRGITLRLACAAACALACAAAAADPTAPLKVCMADGNAPLSYRVNGEPRGLDVALAQAIATEAGRPLKVVFFESEYERDKSLAASK
jgi:ABC-type amino acid transport substrate-binding protein